MVDLKDGVNLVVQKWADQPALYRKILIACIAVFLVVTAFMWPVPGFLLIATAVGVYLSWRKKTPVNVVIVPLCALVVAFMFAYSVSSTQSLPRYDLKKSDWIQSSAQPVVWESWFGSRQLNNPANGAGRVGLIAGSILGLILLYRRTSDGKHSAKRIHGLQVCENAAKGTRRWAGDADLAHVAEFGPPRKGKLGGGTIPGKLDGRIVRLQPEKGVPPLPQHTAVIAGTGAGKSYSFVIANVIAAALQGESIVLTDPKGELSCLLAPWLKVMGYDVSIFNLAWPKWGNMWNPVVECRDDEEISAFALAIVVNGVVADKGSGYFVMKEIQLLKALIYLLRADFPSEQQHLRTALSLLSWPIEALNERFSNSYRAGKLPREGYEEWCGVLSSNIENAISGLTAKLGVVRASTVARLLSRKEIDLSAIGRKKAALFCVIPVDSAHLKPVLASLYYFFFRRLYGLAAEHGGKLPNETRFVLDEFKNIGVIPGFTEIISTARSLGIKVQFILQGLRQLQASYGGADAENIMANCPIQIFLGGDDATTTKYFSSRLGHGAVWEDTERVSKTTDYLAVVKGPLWQLPKRTESRSVTRRSLMEPEELSGMNPLACIALVRWCLPLYLEKLDWKELPQAREIQATKVMTLAELAPERDIEVELPPIPEAVPVEPKKRSRAAERGAKEKPYGQDLQPVELDELFRQAGKPFEVPTDM